MRSNVRVYQRKIVERRRKRALLFSASIAVAASAALGGLSWLSHMESLKVTQVKVEGNQRLGDAELASIVESTMEGRVLGMFSRRNILLVSETGIEKKLTELPIIKTASASVEGLHAVAISVEERRETALFCEGEAGNRLSCYSVDEDGFIFDQVAAADSSAVAYRDPVLEGDFVGKSVRDPETFETIQFFVRELSSIGAVVRDIELGEAGYMTVTLSQGGKLIVNTVDDLSDVLSNVASVLSDRSVAPTASDFLRSLDYMRLDSGNKIFYKLRE